MSIDTKCRTKWEDSLGEKILDACAKVCVGIGYTSTLAYIGYNTTMVVLDKMPNKDLNDYLIPIVFCSALAGASFNSLNCLLSMDENDF